MFHEQFKRMSATPFRATELPWFAEPFRLISWLEMNQFSAKEFMEISGFLSGLVGAAHRRQEAIPSERQEHIRGLLNMVKERCEVIGLRESAKSAVRLADNLHRRSSAE